jgi:ATP/maltotriose-dependent transcriptional regulator MalT
VSTLKLRRIESIKAPTETTLVGRDREVTRIESALSALGHRDSAVLAISGEPGIGKTRLLGELRSRACKRGHTVLAGRGTELEGEAPFAALVEALDDYLCALGPRRLAEISGRLPHLAAVFPAMAGFTQARSGPPAERYRHHRAVRALVEELAGERPLVLVLDDVHWADLASVEAIAHMLRHPPPAPVLIALSFRSGQPSRVLMGALADALRETRAEHLILETLSEEHVGALLAGESPAARRRIFLESGGNPFYIEQLRAAPVAAMAAPSDARAAAAQVPDGVAAAIGQELWHLPDRARQMLEGAAVTGEPFEPELAAETASLPPADALELLDELIARDLVRAESAPRLFRFRHPIVRRAVYDAITPGRQLAAHRRAALALGELGAPAATRAHHLALSARAGDEASIAVLVAAGSQVQTSAPASAAQWLAMALSLLPADQSSRRMALLSQLAGVQTAMGSLTDARETLIEILEALPDRSGSAWSQAVATLACVELHLGCHGGARRRLEMALEAIGAPAGADAVPLLVALAMDLYHHGEFKRAEAAARQALEAAINGGDAVLHAEARAVLALALQAAGRIEASEGCCTRAAAELDALTDDQLAARLEIGYHLGAAECLLERFDDAAGHLGRGASLAASGGNSQFIVPTRTVLADCLARSGRLDDAVRVAEEAVETGRLLRVPADIALALAVAAVTWSAIDAREALRLGEEAVSVLQDLDDGLISDVVRADFALVCANAGEYSRCAEHMELAGAPGFERIDPGRRCIYIEASVSSLRELGRFDDAREQTEVGERLAAGLGLPVAEAAVRRARAQLELAEGNAALAADLALGAAEAAGGRGAVIEAARSRILAGRSLGAAGHRERAVKELRAVRAEMVACGARRLEAEAGRALRGLGATAPAPVARRSGDEGTTALSRREREVAVLVAAGNSNPKIAQTLFLSRRTVDSHMRRIFEKLGVQSRAQLAATIAASSTAG